MYLTLSNVRNVSILTRNIISIAGLKPLCLTYLFYIGFIHTYKNEVFYFEAIPLNGIYEVKLYSSLKIFLYNMVKTKYSNMI